MANLCSQADTNWEERHSQLVDCLPQLTCRHVCGGIFLFAQPAMGGAIPKQIGLSYVNGLDNMSQGISQ